MQMFMRISWSNVAEHVCVFFVFFQAAKCFPHYNYGWLARFSDVCLDFSCFAGVFFDIFTYQELVPLFYFTNSYHMISCHYKKHGAEARNNSWCLIYNKVLRFKVVFSNSEYCNLFCIHILYMFAFPLLKYSSLLLIMYEPACQSSVHCSRRY
jgi:hypothetical protein